MMSKTCWQSPSNLALIKYWGKYDRQLPRNPSISFTLSNAHTTTFLEYIPSNRSKIIYRYDGLQKPEFSERVVKYINSLVDEFPFIKDYELIIDSINSFPHSSGIASSASFMSSLALCLCSMEADLMSWELDMRRVSHIARLGSGSASRSVFPYMAAWGESLSVSLSSNLYAVGVSKNVHPTFKSWHDDILIVSTDKKSVSSSLGHLLMEKNPYADVRYRQANEHFDKCLRLLQEGDEWALGELIESEALILHGLMMSSSPGYILLRPETLLLIEQIRSYRKAMNIPIFFSLDAGPNIHLLYPDSVSSEIESFKKTVLNQHCIRILEDHVGTGPIKII